MIRKIALIVALLGGLLISGSVPAGANGSSIPRHPNIVDIAGDANGLSNTDLATPVQIPEADLLAAWFTNDRTTITAHWHVSATPQPADSIQLIIDTNPDPADPAPEIPGVIAKRRCLFFSVVFRRDDLQPRGGPYTAFTDACIHGEELLKWFIGDPSVRELEDGTAIVSARIPRRETPALQGRSVLTGLRARSANADWVAGRRALAKSYDSARVGRDYRLR